MFMNMSASTMSELMRMKQLVYQQTGVTLNVSGDHAIEEIFDTCLNSGSNILHTAAKTLWHKLAEDNVADRQRREFLKKLHNRMQTTAVSH